MGEFETRLIRREAWENRPGEAEFAAKCIIAAWAERRKSVYADSPCATSRLSLSRPPKLTPAGSSRYSSVGTGRGPNRGAAIVSRCCCVFERRRADANQPTCGTETATSED